MPAQYTTMTPDNRLIGMAVKIEDSKDANGDKASTTKTVYTVDGVEVTKAQAQAIYDAQPSHWQRGRTFQQMIDFWLGKGGMAR